MHEDRGRIRRSRHTLRLAASRARRLAVALPVRHRRVLLAAQRVAHRKAIPAPNHHPAPFRALCRPQRGPYSILDGFRGAGRRIAPSRVARIDCPLPSGGEMPSAANAALIGTRRSVAEKLVHRFDRGISALTIGVPDLVIASSPPIRLMIGQWKNNWAHKSHMALPND